MATAATTVPQVVATDPTVIPHGQYFPEDSTKVKSLPISSACEATAECLILGVWNEKGKFQSLNASVAVPAWEDLLSRMDNVLGKAEFQAIAGSVEWCRFPSASNFKVVAVIGMGGTSGTLQVSGTNPVCGSALTNQMLHPTKAQKIGAGIARFLREARPDSATVVFPNSPSAAVCGSSSFDSSFYTQFIQSVVEVMYVESYPDNRFKTMNSKKRKMAHLKTLNFIASHSSELQTVIENAGISAHATQFCMDLTNAPANYCNPIALANVAKEIAAEFDFECKVLNRKEIESLKMGMYLGVAKGSFYEPQFIHLTYTPPGETSQSVKSKIALVGKGICFDSGGYNIKSMASHIEIMKMDMGGAGALLGCAMAVGKMKPKSVQVHYIIPACENMVSDKAYRPGDILTASNGKTVEIGNTDAEGRLTLGDALVYAENLNVDAIVDIATLTGACVVALGPGYAGLWSTSDVLAAKIENSALAAGECVWKMPLVEEYRDSLDSRCADMNNISKPGFPGAIIAALFLNEFVESTPWAHIDIAGPAWNSSERFGTGFGARTLTEFVMKFQTDKKC